MIEPENLQAALDRAWRLSGESPVAEELAVIQCAQLARIADSLERISQQLPGAQPVQAQRRPSWW